MLTDVVVQVESELFHAHKVIKCLTSENHSLMDSKLKSSNCFNI